MKCPKNHKKGVLVTECFNCEFVGGDTMDGRIYIICRFPYWSRRPKVKKIERDGVI